MQAQEDKTIAEGNKLICEFMGLVRYNEKGHHYEYGYYHQQWQYLMPVVEKIGRFGFIQLTVNHYHQNFVHVTPESNKEGFSVAKEGDENTLMECTWQAVVQFIQWYNSLTSK